MRLFRRFINGIYLVIFLVIFGVIIHFFYIHMQAFLPFKEEVGLTDHHVLLEEVDVHNVIRNFDVTEQAECVPVIMYHRIVPDQRLVSNVYESKNKLYKTVVTESQFSKQMEYLHEAGYTVLNLRELYAFLTEQIDIPKKSVVITLDDGYKDIYYTAYPILKKYNFTAVSFIITSEIEEKNATYIPEVYQYLSKTEMLKSQDVFDYQAHTFDLHERDEEGVSLLLNTPKHKVKNDLQQNIQHLNGKEFAFAYPFGEYTRETMEILKNEFNFKMAFTTEPGYASPTELEDFYQIPRIEVSPEYSLDDFKAILEGKGM
ncbi:polysaccharide deacetylase family protein [Virgibacillus sp. W0181]|uniref:polysaccharide deacetylase family protein n=1 Tax=Virgibacillus sp. W0181 TaxID=3391581 RepID=UPI003F44765B